MNALHDGHVSSLRYFLWAEARLAYGFTMRTTYGQYVTQMWPRTRLQILFQDRGTFPEAPLYLKGIS